MSVIAGRVEGTSILSAADGRISLDVRALTGDTPLMPLPVTGLLNAEANADPPPPQGACVPQLP